MPKGISIHIGLNSVDPDHYQGWDGALTACEADAMDMFAIAKKQGFKTQTPILTQDASAAAVTAALKDAAKKLSKGDMLLLTYSGHGGQVKDTNGDEDDAWDETWALYDRELVDDELYDMWGRFRSGVRIFVLSDSCHSGTVLRIIPRGKGRIKAMPTTIVKAVDKAHRALYRGIQKKVRGSEKAKVKASVLLISGCMDNQTSRDGTRNGAFTGALRKVWKNGAFKGTYRKFRDLIRASLPSDQSPNYYFVGAPSPTYEGQRPFTI